MDLTWISGEGQGGAGEESAEPGFAAAQWAAKPGSDFSTGRVEPGTLVPPHHGVPPTPLASVKTKEDTE